METEGNAYFLVLGSVWMVTHPELIRRSRKSSVCFLSCTVYRIAERLLGEVRVLGVVAREFLMFFSPLGDSFPRL